MQEINVPYNWRPRDYQLPLWKQLESGCKRAVHVWHRRAGKDLFDLNWLIRSAFMTVGTYWHIFPQFTQGRKAIWEETTIEGRKYIDFFPQEYIKSKNNHEMKIELLNGSVYRIVGSDDVDKLRGAGIKGAIFSEYAEQDPRAYETIQPMLMATKGWAVFNFTPKGENHAYDLYKMAQDSPDWHAEIRTVDDTQVFTQEALNQFKNELIAQGREVEFFEQEYYCSFTGVQEGAYYQNQMIQADKDNRITRVPYDEALQVHTAWDLGVGDATSIWFFQIYGSEVRLIDFYENSGEGLAHYIKVLKEKPYVYGYHFAPHDIGVTEFGTGKTRIEMAYELGFSFEVLPRSSIEDGINAVRALLGRCYFDKDKCKQGIRALRSYHKEFDEKRGVFKIRPVHDWSSHAADSFRYLAMSYVELVGDFNETRDIGEYEQLEDTRSNITGY